MAANFSTSPPPYHAPSLLPQPSDTALAHHFLGRKLADVQAPAVVLDAAVVRRNCKLMLDTARELGVGFRAHVKTHKVSLRFFSLIYLGGVSGMCCLCLGCIGGWDGW